MSKASESKSHNKLYIWLFLLTIAFFILGFYVFFDLWIVKGKVTKVDADSSYVNAIIAISGFLAAFSAISIYSIFNANVDRQREEIETLTNQLRSQREEVEELTNQLKGQVQNFKRSDKEISELLNNTIMITQLTLPHSGERLKIEAIKHFSIIPIDDVIPNNKETLLNFFKSLGKKQTNKTYYKELEKLLKDWRMIP
jgi:uncharacterized membrane protein (DUF485 family)